MGPSHKTLKYHKCDSVGLYMQLYSEAQFIAMKYIMVMITRMEIQSLLNALIYSLCHNHINNQIQSGKSLV